MLRNESKPESIHRPSTARSSLLAGAVATVAFLGAGPQSAIAAEKHTSKPARAAAAQREAPRTPHGAILRIGRMIRNGQKLTFADTRIKDATTRDARSPSGIRTCDYGNPVAMKVAGEVDETIYFALSQTKQKAGRLATLKVSLLGEADELGDKKPPMVTGVVRLDTDGTPGIKTRNDGEINFVYVGFEDGCAVTPPAVIESIAAPGTQAPGPV